MAVAAGDGSGRTVGCRAGSLAAEVEKVYRRVGGVEEQDRALTPRPLNRHHRVPDRQTLSDAVLAGGDAHDPAVAAEQIARGGEVVRLLTGPVNRRLNP